MSYSNSFPTQKTTLNLDFANSGKLDSRISFSRSDTPPTYAAPSAVHYWSNEKHKSSENLVTQSDGSDWIFTSADYTKTASQNGPDGSTNATKYTEKANGSTEYQIRSNNFTPIANKEITYSVWLKQTSGSRNYQQVRVGNIGANQAFVTFNLTNGTVDQTGGTLGVSASVNDGPTGWYQCVMKFTPTTTTALSFYIYAAAASGGEIPNVTGDTGNSFTMFGAQASTTGETVVNETSGQIHREFAPTLKSVSNAGDPRFEYSPTDGQSKGLLIEASATNLQRYGSAFASWSSEYNVSVKSDAAVAPNGKLEADLVTATSTPGGHYVYDNGATLASGTDYTASVYVKNAGQRYVQLVGSASNFGGSKWATFDLVDGSIDATNVTASAESVGNGWWRIQGTMAATGSTQGNIFVALADSATAARSPSFTGDDYSGVLLFGYQLEAGSSASSLVDTGSGSSQLSRASDSCSVALSDAGYTGGRVSGIVEAKNIGKPYPTFATLTDSTSNQRILLQGNEEATFVTSSIVTDGAVVATPTSALTAASSKVGFRCDTDNFGTVVNGGTVATDTSGAQPATMTTLHIGQKQDGNFQVNGHIGRVSLYSVALSNVELQSLTS